PRLNRPAWASLANNEAAPATSNKANRIFAFMGVLKKETGCLLRRHTPNPFQRLGDQNSYWQQSSNPAGGVSWANWFHDMLISRLAWVLPRQPKSGTVP